MFELWRNENENDKMFSEHVKVATSTNSLKMKISHSSWTSLTWHDTERENQLEISIYEENFRENVTWIVELTFKVRIYEHNRWWCWSESRAGNTLQSTETNKSAKKWHIRDIYVFAGAKNVKSLMEVNIFTSFLYLSDFKFIIHLIDLNFISVELRINNIRVILKWINYKSSRKSSQIVNIQYLYNSEFRIQTHVEKFNLISVWNSKFVCSYLISENVN